MTAADPVNRRHLPVASRCGAEAWRNAPPRRRAAVPMAQWLASRGISHPTFHGNGGHG
jgi:hypothetical protein